MEKRLKRYLDELNNLDIDGLNDAQKESFCKDLLIQIGFFQHERLIHLIVTLAFAVLSIISVCILIVSLSIPTSLLTVLLMIMLIAYLKHYYVLENGVQKLYGIYDEFIKQLNNI